MRIRRAAENEAELLTAIAMEAKAHWGYSAEQMAAWQNELHITPERVAGSPVHVCELDGQIAGFYSFDTSGTNWQLDNFWVRLAFMRRGVGKALLKHAVALAAAKHVPAISIDADPNAERFYLANGAMRVGSVAAPIAGAPGRERPQLLLTVSR